MNARNVSRNLTKGKNNENNKTYINTILIGCDEVIKTMEETIYDYYELLHTGNLEDSQEILDWNNKEASIIDYFGSMNKLQKQHDLKTIKDVLVTSITEVDGKGEATAKITYEDANQKEIIEINKLRLSQNRQGQWKITSIIRE